MLENISSREELGPLMRARTKPVEYKSVPNSHLDKAVEEGWSIIHRGKSQTRVSRPKLHGQLLEDRVWSLMYRMGFEFLSGRGGARLVLAPSDSNSPKSQIDVVAVDNDVSVAIECKSTERPGRRSQFQDELGKFSLIREKFATAVNREIQGISKRQSILIFWTWDIFLSDNDRKRAEEAKIVLLDEHDLNYYEALTAQIGPAARYQFLSEVIPGRTIPGLKVRVPAIKTKVGDHICYSFAVSPEYLLKIAFVSHRARGRASDINTYQRMIKKSRLRKIQEFILDDGVFPTNIVLNLDKKPTFDQVAQDGDDRFSKVGYLTLSPSYKSAWVIDGQHRLYAYSGLEQAATARLAVLAFEQLSSSEQASMFVEINGKQKSVKQSLLQELYAELHWDSDDYAVRTSAVVSKAIQALDSDRNSPFYRRIKLDESAASTTRCITLTALFKELDKSDLYVSFPRKGGPEKYGPLWSGDKLERTLNRTLMAVNGWFRVIESHANDWWARGSDVDGGLAMNDGVSACLAVLRSVYAHLEDAGVQWATLSDDELVEIVAPFAHSLGRHLGSLDESQRRAFRKLRGAQGVAARMRQCQDAIQKEIPAFLPPGLEAWRQQLTYETNEKAEAICKKVETHLQREIISQLKEHFGEEHDSWWYKGIPDTVRKSAAAKQEEDKGQRPKENYLDLINYRQIMLDNWVLFGPVFGQPGISGNKEKKTGWLVTLNGIRNITAHPSSGRNVTMEQLAELESLQEWLLDSGATFGGEPMVGENDTEVEGS